MSENRHGSSSQEASAEQQSEFTSLEQRRRKHRIDGLNILIVEDTQDARHLIERNLLSAGANVFSASSADEARELLRTSDIDAIVSDIGMPEEDGISFIRGVRESEKANGRHVPAIALTAYVGLEHRDMTIRAGFEEHLCKPVSSETLIDAILRVVVSGSSSLH